jgi:hypothetical protein
VHLTYLAIVFLVAASPSEATSQGGKPGKTDEARAKCEAYLGDHDVPALSELHSLVAMPAIPLMAIASDDKVTALTRARAVAALRLLPSPTVQEFLGKLVTTKAKAVAPDDRLILRRAAVALGWMPASDTPNRLALLFENADPEVRLDAVIGLALTRSEVAPVLLRRQLAVETVARVRNQIERQLQVLDNVDRPPPEPEKTQPIKTPMRGGF